MEHGTRAGVQEIDGAGVVLFFAVMFSNPFEKGLELIYPDKTLRQMVGLDTRTFHDGLKYVLRQDPDIILVGEIRDLETMRTVLMAADTGHLVLSSLHTTDVSQTLQRIISFFPHHQHDEVRRGVASNLKAVITQRLIPRADGRGRVPSAEIMVSTPTIQECGTASSVRRNGATARKKIKTINSTLPSSGAALDRPGISLAALG